MITTTKKKRSKLSAILGQTSINAESAVSTNVSAESAPTFTQRLNEMIAAGVSFDVGPDNFQAFGASERETAFLHDNQAAILCTLHQSLLMKYLPLDHVVRFTDEINERTAILSDGANGEPPFEVVAEVSREWFIDMSEELLKR